MKTKSLMFGMAVALSSGVANAQYWNSTNGNMLEALNSTNGRAVYVGIGVAPSTSYRLNVSGGTNLQGTARVGSSLTVVGKSFLSAVTASSDIYGKGKLTVDGYTYLNGASTFIGKVTMPSGFTATNPSTVTSSFNVGGQTTLNGHVGIGDAPIDSKVLYVKGDVSVIGGMSVNATGSTFNVGLTGSGGITFKNESSTGNTISSNHQGKNNSLAFKASSFTFTAGNVSMAKNLDVAGKITCHNEIEVTALNADAIKAKDLNLELPNAADYVFDDNYNLKSLKEVETYVKANKHLPGVPSASEIAENGLSVSQMSNILLEKVEELTLHLIQLEKENQNLKEKVEELNKLVK